MKATCKPNGLINKYKLNSSKLNKKIHIYDINLIEELFINVKTHTPHDNE